MVGPEVLPVQTRGIAVHEGPDPLGGGRIRDRKQGAGLAVLQAAGNPIGDAVRRRHDSVPQPVEFAIGRNLERHDRNRFGRRKDRGMSGTGEGRKVHLVGSAPFATAEEMFRAAAARLGRHRAGHRFQFGLPTPLSVTSVYIVPASRDPFEAASARALGRELEKILAAIPAAKLAIQ